MSRIFGKKKRQELEQQLAQLAIQKERQEQEQRWKEHQLQEQLRNQQEQLRNQQEQQRQLKEQWEVERVERVKRENEQRDIELRKVRAREAENAQAKIRAERRLERLRRTTPEALRDLRDLIRLRYQLDIEIWNDRDARRPDRPFIEEKMEKADAILKEIQTTVELWEENAEIWKGEEWDLARRIKEQLLKDGKRMWVPNPPWNEA